MTKATQLNEDHVEFNEAESLKSSIDKIYGEIGYAHDLIESKQSKLLYNSFSWVMSGPARKLRDITAIAIGIPTAIVGGSISGAFIAQTVAHVSPPIFSFINDSSIRETSINIAKVSSGIIGGIIGGGISFLAGSCIPLAPEPIAYGAKKVYDFGNLLIQKAKLPVKEKQLKQEISLKKDSLNLLALSKPELFENLLNQPKDKKISGFRSANNIQVQNYLNSESLLSIEKFTFQNNNSRIEPI